MLDTWFLAVRGLIWSSTAISLLSRPRAISVSTSSSRGESGSLGPGSGPGSGSAAPGGARGGHSRNPPGGPRPGPGGAAPGGPDRDRHLFDRRLLEQVAARAGCQRRGDVALLGRDGQRDDARLRVGGDDLARGVRSVE